MTWLISRLTWVYQGMPMLIETKIWSNYPPTRSWSSRKLLNCECWRLRWVVPEKPLMSSTRKSRVGHFDGLLFALFFGCNFLFRLGESPTYGVGTFLIKENTQYSYYTMCLFICTHFCLFLNKWTSFIIFFKIIRGSKSGVFIGLDLANSSSCLHTPWRDQTTRSL